MCFLPFLIDRDRHTARLRCWPVRRREPEDIGHHTLIEIAGRIGGFADWSMSPGPPREHSGQPALDRLRDHGDPILAAKGITLQLSFNHALHTVEIPAVCLRTSVTRLAELQTLCLSSPAHRVTRVNTDGKHRNIVAYQQEHVKRITEAISSLLSLALHPI